MDIVLVVLSSLLLIGSIVYLFAAIVNIIKFNKKQNISIEELMKDSISKNELSNKECGMRNE